MMLHLADDDDHHDAVVIPSSFLPSFLRSQHKVIPNESIKHCYLQPMLLLLNYDGDYNDWGTSLLLVLLLLMLI